MMSGNIYLHFLLTKPRAFLLLSYLNLKAWDLDSSTVTFEIEDIKTVGCRPILTQRQVRAALLWLVQWGYVEVRKHPTWKSLLEITLIKREFPYV